MTLDDPFKKEYGFTTFEYFGKGGDIEIVCGGVEYYLIDPMKISYAWFYGEFNAQVRLVVEGKEIMFDFNKPEDAKEVYEFIKGIRDR